MATKEKYNIDFLGMRKLAMGFSLLFVIISIASLAIRGLSFGIDFTGGTLVEVSYQNTVEIEEVRNTLSEAGFNDAIVQYFGTAKDVMIRVPLKGKVKGAQVSEKIMRSLHNKLDESVTDTDPVSKEQTCSIKGQRQVCKVQMRRVEFVGPQVGDELANQGGLAMLYALFGILAYVAFRFEWRFAVGSVIALVHDVTITIGVFSLFQMEFTLTVLAAILAVIGYSLNDTIVVFDRIRENFRKLRKESPQEIMNRSINQTLPRTILTSLTTLLVLISLYFFGGDIIHNFSVALILGIVVGTYSSIYIASPAVLMLGVSRENLLQVKQEGGEKKATP
ncbi:MAG TPA: protein translocase subunit SecF [Gammaproteobacteria bacterium]|nr:preprotein translocase subunit SecF [bacterium BMS3Abin11]HDH15680.1 protein translocase subunit SecF [Gammaproteobacteria bacterium]HDZ78307.1 protein translocase subunit SecF [Gammaproteobacteria bacterium]